MFLVSTQLTSCFAGFLGHFLLGISLGKVSPYYSWKACSGTFVDSIRTSFPTLIKDNHSECIAF